MLCIKKSLVNKSIIWKNMQKNQVAAANYFSAVSFNELKPFRVIIIYAD